MNEILLLISTSFLSFIRSCVAMPTDGRTGLAVILSDVCTPTQSMGTRRIKHTPPVIGCFVGLVGEIDGQLGGWI